jgi:serine/threonine-protein kinase
VWRGDSALIRESGRHFLSRMSSNASSIYKFVTQVESAGTIDDAGWRSMMGETVDPQRPLRQYLVRLQIFSELALALDQTDKAIESIGRVVDLGLMDLTWMDHCPLMEKIVEAPEFAALRRRVADRATRVLAAFRNTSGTTAG